MQIVSISFVLPELSVHPGAYKCYFTVGQSNGISLVWLSIGTLTVETSLVPSQKHLRKIRLVTLGTLWYSCVAWNVIRTLIGATYGLKLSHEPTYMYSLMPSRNIIDNTVRVNFYWYIHILWTCEMFVNKT